MKSILDESVFYHLGHLELSPLAFLREPLFASFGAHEPSWHTFPTRLFVKLSDDMSVALNVLV